jgi:hypothetical protein
VQITASSNHHAALPLELLFTLGLVSLALNLTHPKADFARLFVLSGFHPPLANYMNMVSQSHLRQYLRDLASQQTTQNRTHAHLDAFDILDGSVRTILAFEVFRAGFSTLVG